MVRRFQCSNCGEHGWILSDEPTVAPRCLRCSHRLEVEPAGVDGNSRGSVTVDDTVVSWLSQPSLVPSPRSDAVASCVSCGFEGLMQYDSQRGDTICPACLAVYRSRPERGRQLLDCPNCQRPIEIHESDRGKTIVCPECNYFLGCVLRQEKRRLGALPFLNVLLGAAKD
jgi:DNA-directed RNA polymerase subunit RPC12/RpoP